MDQFWFILAIVLATTSLGFQGIVNLTFATIAFILGSFTILLGICFSKPVYNQVANICEFSKQTWLWFQGPLVSTDCIKKNISEVTEIRRFWEKKYFSPQTKFSFSYYGLGKGQHLQEVF